MAIDYNDAVKTTRMQAVVTALGGSASLKIYTAADALLVSVPLANPVGTVANDVLTFTINNAHGTTGASGTAAKASLYAGAVEIASGLTVGVSSGDVRLCALDLITGDTVRITQATITHG